MRLRVYWELLFWNISFRRVGIILCLIRVWVIKVVLHRVDRITLNSQRGSLLVLFLSLLTLILIIFFFTKRFFILYFMFELSLIPIFIIIIGWGYQVERFKARMIIMFYTLFASLPLLIILIYLNLLMRRLYLFNETFRVINLDIITRSIFWILLIAFLVKTPIYVFHSWLPKAHVEAPVFGSMILAAVLLKLGTYGVYILSVYLKSQNLFNLVVRISLCGILFVGFSCVRAIDLKIIIALSSVSHIGIVLVRLGLQRLVLELSRVYIILRHGVSSSLLFLAAGIIYSRRHSRILLFRKGLNIWLPVFSLIWFLIIVMNMAGPPRVNLLREFLMLIFFSNYRFFFSLFIFLGVIVGRGYSLLIFRILIQGWEISYWVKFNLRCREILITSNYLISGFSGVFYFFLIY